MEQRKLTNEQNIRSAIIFLNAFGLKLKTKKNISDEESLVIVDSNNNKVGKLCINDDYIIINALTVLGKMSAQYRKSSYNTTYDMSNDGLENCDWSSDINFEIIKNEHEEFSGSFKVMSLINEKGEKLIAIKPLIEYLVDRDGVVSISFEGDKESFRAFINDKYSYEEIIYRPYILSSDSYDDVLNCPSVIIDKRTSSDKISEYEVYEARRMITALENIGTTSFGYESERSFEDKDERLAQMVRKMNRVNPRIERRVRGLREIFNVDGIDLINNFLAVSSDPEQYDNVYNLMGFKREPLVYQNGSTDLSTAYFDKSFDKMFMTNNKQKKLIKNN